MNEMFEKLEELNDLDHVREDLYELGYFPEKSMEIVNARMRKINDWFYENNIQIGITQFGKFCIVGRYQDNED